MRRYKVEHDELVISLSDPGPDLLRTFTAWYPHREPENWLIECLAMGLL